jgi:hypothetical protein
MEILASRGLMNAGNSSLHKIEPINLHNNTLQFVKIENTNRNEHSQCIQMTTNSFLKSIEIISSRDIHRALP